jgi:hypothetical protein
MNEPWSRVLRMPLDEVIRNVFEGQEIEAEDGAGAQIRLLSELMARIM